MEPKLKSPIERSAFQSLLIFHRKACENIKVHSQQKQLRSVVEETSNVNNVNNNRHCVSFCQDRVKGILSIYSEETMSSSVDVENWSGRWWFPEQTWSFDEAIDLTFEPKDIKLIGSIVK